MANRPFFRYLDTNGDGTGTKVANLEFATADQFFIQPPEGETFVIERMITYIADAVTSRFDPLKYGDIAQLTNGITVKVTDADDNVLLDLTDGLPIKSNGAWMRTCYDANEMADVNTNAAIGVRWTFGRAVPSGYADEGRTPIVLQDQQKLVVTLNDDLRGLLDHTFMAQGVKMNYPGNLAD